MEWTVGENPVGFWPIVFNIVTFLLALLIALAIVAAVCFIVYLAGTWVYEKIDDWIWRQGASERQREWESLDAWHKSLREEAKEEKESKTNDK